MEGIAATDANTRIRRLIVPQLNLRALTIGQNGYAVEARGTGGTQQMFIRGSSAPRPNPLPFYIPFFTKKVPLSYTFIDKWHPLHIPSVTLCIPFNCNCKCTVL